MKNRYHDLPSSCIELHGWAEEFITRQKSGLTGHPEEQGFPFNGGMWTEIMDFRDREFSDFGSGWWPYEQTAYYLDGALRCAYLSDSEDLLKKVRKNIKYFIDSADENGQMHIAGVEDDSWPIVVFMRMLFQEYDCTKDEELREAIRRHYYAVYSDSATQNIPTGSGFDIRLILHVEHLCRLTDITEDFWFTERAEELYKQFTESSLAENNPIRISLTAEGMINAAVPAGHGVTYNEFLKLPAILYISTGKPQYLKAMENAFKMLADNHELSSGLASSIEELYGKAPHLAHEVCNVIDFNWACGWALLATGNSVYADKMEKVLYNAGMSSVTSDFKAHQYYSAPNMPISTDYASSWNDQYDWGHQAKANFCYRPGHSTECCSGNIHRMLPTYINRMCLVEKDAVNINFYIPSTVDIDINGELLRMRQVTNYPFEHSSNITIESAPQKEVAVRFRIPAWADSYVIEFNDEIILKGTDSGFFAEIKRIFKDGDRIQISFDASPVIDDRDSCIAVNYGPLVFSYPVPAKELQTTNDSVGKCSNEFPAYQLVPAKADGWQYAVSPDISNKDLSLAVRCSNDYPWDYNYSGLTITMTAFKVKNWRLEDFTRLGKYPETIEKGEAVSLNLIPMGCTLLRMTDFPKVSR